MFINSDVFMFCIKKFSNIVFATVLTLNLLVASGKTTLKKTSPMKRLFRCSCFPTRSRSSESKNVAAPSPPKRQLSQSPDKSPSREVPIQSESDTSDVDVWHEYPNPFADFVMITMLKFKEGDVLFTQQGRTLVAISETKLAQVLAGKRCWSWTAIITRNKRGNLITARFVDIPDTKSWSREQRAALMRKLMNKKLPYRYYSCNEEHYLAYILHGTTHKSSYSKCPLGRDLAMITAKEIERVGFELQNTRGKPVVPETAEFNQFSDRYNRRTPVSRTSQAREGP
nr:PREDICTED: uncharacterized protein LOC109034385 isoform X3 [Bemisia tabaci]